MSNKDTNIYYCVGCGTTHPKGNFYVSYNKSHANGRLFYCKDFIKSKAYMGDKVMLDEFKKLLREFNIPFLNDTYESAIESKGDTIGHYFRMFNSLPQNRGLTWDNSVFIDEDVEVEERDIANEVIRGEITEGSIDIHTRIFWGNGFSLEEYMFLESELSNWKMTHKCDNQAETTLLKEICIKILEIRKLRGDNKDVSKTLKDLQDLMKTASVDPAKANIADGGKSLDAYGLWIKDIEMYEPADYYEDKELFKDFDKIKSYTDKYILRPLKNLLTGSRDFDIGDEKTEHSKSGDK